MRGKLINGGKIWEYGMDIGNIILYQFTTDDVIIYFIFLFLRFFW